MAWLSLNIAYRRRLAAAPWPQDKRGIGDCTSSAPLPHVVESVLSKRYRLKRNVQIQDLRRRGRSWHNRTIVLVKRANQRPDSRFAFSVSRKIGKAVVRNRIKRLMRESIRLSMASIQPGWDVLLIARQPTRQATFVQVDRAVKELLVRSRLCPEIAHPTRPAARSASPHSVSPHSVGQSRLVGTR